MKTFPPVSYKNCCQHVKEVTISPYSPSLLARTTSSTFSAWGSPLDWLKVVSLEEKGQGNSFCCLKLPNRRLGVRRNKILWSAQWGKDNRRKSQQETLRKKFTAMVTNTGTGCPSVHVYLSGYLKHSWTKPQLTWTSLVLLRKWLN